jgi:hypothetical protein
MPRFLLSALSLSAQGSKSLFVQARCMSSQSKICALIVGKFYKNYCIKTIRIVRDLIPKILDRHLMAHAEIVSWTLKADQTDILKDLPFQFHEKIQIEFQLTNFRFLNFLCKSKWRRVKNFVKTRSVNNNNMIIKSLG